MSNVTGLVFKSHFRLNILIFKCNVILSLLFGTSQSEKPRRRQTALLQMGARPSTNGGPSASATTEEFRPSTNAEPSVQMDARPKGQHCYKRSEDRPSVLKWSNNGWKNSRMLQLSDRPKEDGTPTNERPSEATNGDRPLQMSDRPKNATNEQPFEETRSNGRELQRGPPKTAEEDNRPPKRTTVRRRGQP